MARTPAHELQLDYPVFTSDGDRLGFVKEIRRDAFKVDAPWQRDFWIPIEHVQSVIPNERVTLDVTRSDIEKVKYETLAELEDARSSQEYSQPPDRSRRGVAVRTDVYTGPDYEVPGPHWETVPRRPDFSYGAWKDQHIERLPTQRLVEGRPQQAERRGLPPGACYPLEAEADVPWRSPRPLTDDGGLGPLAGTGRYAEPPGPAGRFPHYHPDQGWGYQGQERWSARFGAPATYSEPLGNIGFGGEDLAEYTGQPGRGYDPEVWGYPAYDTESPWDYAGRGPRGYRRSDERIKEDVNEELTKAGDVDATNIEVDVQDGEVILRGTVTTRYQKRAAEDIALAVRGVRDVRNEIKVVPAEVASRG